MNARKFRISLGALLAVEAFVPTIAHAQSTEPVAAPDRPSAPAADDKGWAERDAALNESATMTGAVGLLRLQQATGALPGQVRLGLLTEAFSSGFLCTPQFPCRNPRGGAAITSDSVGHAGATLAIGAGLVTLGPGVLEGYLSSGAFTTSDAVNAPSLLPVLGDTTLGFRYGAPLTRALSLGGLIEGRVPGSTGSVGPDFGSTSIRLGTVLTGDLRAARLPLRFGLNLGYTFDNGAHGLSETEAALGAPVSRVDRFAFGANRVDSLDARLGGEVFLWKEKLRPFVEYAFLLPVNRQGYQCRSNNPSGDGCLATTPVVPSTLTVGGRISPWKQGLSFLVALDVGVTGTSTFIEELAPTAPWMFHAGVGWAFDVKERPPVVREVVKMSPAPAAPKLAKVHGLVHDQAGIPIENAKVRYTNHPELFPLATSEKGIFGDELAPGDYALAIEAEGFAPGTCAGHVDGAHDLAIDCPLTTLPSKGTLVVTVRDLDTGAPLPGVRVQLGDGKDFLASDPAGAVRFEGLAVGSVRVGASDEHHLTFAGAVDVRARETTRVDWTLRSIPTGKNAGVVIGASGIRLTRAVEFEGEGSSLAPTSSSLLAELADAVVRHPELRRIEIQSHGDPSADVQQLTDARAEAVRTWLVARGVPADRLVAKGYGATHPRAPNVTSANRAANRRIELVVLEKAPSGSEPISLGGEHP